MPALLALTACGGSAPAAPSQPTVQAAATQVVGAAATAQSAASPVVATAQAAAAPAAATAQAAASPVATGAAAAVGTASAMVSPAASPSPSPAAQAQVRIADASLADATPWVSLQNDGAAPVDVGGWQLRVGTTTAELPENAVVPPGATLTLHAGEGMSGNDELYLGDAGSRLASAAQPGASVRLTDETGRTVAEATVPRF